MITIVTAKTTNSYGMIGISLIPVDVLAGSSIFVLDIRIFTIASSQDREIHERDNLARLVVLTPAAEPLRLRRLNREA